MKIRAIVESAGDVDGWMWNRATLDKHGNPIRFYHGTNSTDDHGGAIRDFRKSPDGLLGAGIYFTPDTEYASTHASNGYVIPVYLRTRKPLYVRHAADGIGIVRQIAMVFDDWFLSNGARERWVRTQWDDYVGIGDPEFTDMMRDGGYDSVIVVDSTGAITEMTVMSNHQIRSAI